MSNLWKFIQYGYLLTAFILIIDGILLWKTSQSPYMSFIFAGLFIALFFFKNHFRKKTASRSRQNN